MIGMGRSISLGTKASLSTVRRSIRTELNKVGAGSETSFDCLVAVTEACTNAIMHGRRDRSDSVPEVSWTITPEAAEFYVRDYSSHPWPETPTKRDFMSDEIALDERIGGFGLHLMRDLMDEVQIDCSDDGTKVCLVKHLQETVSAS
jgi:serine/threonine-protein kinase RsbW